MLLEQLLARRIVLLDGAMGTMIQGARLAAEDDRGGRVPGPRGARRAGGDGRGTRFHAWERELRGNNDLLSLTQPRLVRDIHWQYLEAGAGNLQTNNLHPPSVPVAAY